MYYAETPGLYTDIINPFPFPGVNWPFLVDCGYEWATFQVYNPQLTFDIQTFDLAAVRAHGIKAGVWGVIYDRTDFYNGGKKIGKAAVDQGADHCIVDAEQCMKDTREGRLAKSIIKGVRDGGWTGPVDLSTLGAPWSPLTNDYAMDLESFLETGGSIHSQDYLNESEGYHPKYAIQYYAKLGIPLNRINHTIGLYAGTRGQINGAGWVDILGESGIHRNFSVYMVQDGQAVDYESLTELSKPILIKPLDSTATKEGMKALADAWLADQASQGLPQTKSRIRLARRILGSNDIQLQKFRDAIYNALNSAGVNQ